MPAPSAPPWYCFLYRLFGAQGTFWLWVITIIALWWTGNGAALRFRNMRKSHVAVADVVREPGGRRWVDLVGLELELDEQLIPAKGLSGPSRTRVVLDSNDRAAIAWRRVRALVDSARPLLDRAPLGAAAALGDLAGLVAVPADPEARAAMAELRASTLHDPQAFLPPPGSAILLIGDEPFPPPGGPAQPVAPDGRPGDPLRSYDAGLDRWADLAQARVHPGVRRDGLLDEAPAAVLERLEREAGLRLAPQALRVGRKPRDLELFVFGGALLLTLFLLAGFQGVVRWERAQRGPAA